MPERGKVARVYGQMTEDLVNHVKEFEFYPEGKREPMKHFKRKSDTVCLEKNASGCCCRFGKRRDQGRGRTRPQLREEEAWMHGRWAQERHFICAVVNRWGVWIILVTCESRTPGLHDSEIL